MLICFLKPVLSLTYSVSYSVSWLPLLFIHSLCFVSFRVMGVWGWSLSQHALDKVLGGYPVQITGSIQCQHTCCTTTISFIQQFTEVVGLVGETVAGNPGEYGKITETQREKELRSNDGTVWLLYIVLDRYMIIFWMCLPFFKFGFDLDIVITCCISWLSVWPRHAMCWSQSTACTTVTIFFKTVDCWLNTDLVESDF